MLLYILKVFTHFTSYSGGIQLIVPYMLPVTPPPPDNFGVFGSIVDFSGYKVVFDNRRRRRFDNLRRCRLERFRVL
jgi:hypothetical protein